jgi:hypothetical protein
MFVVFNCNEADPFAMKRPPPNKSAALLEMLLFRNVHKTFARDTAPPLEAVPLAQLCSKEVLIN